MNDAAAPRADHRFGFVALVGRTNVGKSTLLNRLLGTKIAIVSPVAQTTRHRILAVLSRDDAQIAFLDSPGYHRPQHRLGELLVERARQVADEADVVLFVVDAAAGLGPGDRRVAEELDPRSGRKKVIAVLNKLDLINRGKVLPMIEQVTGEWGCHEAVPVSAETGENCDRLLDVIVAHLPPGPPHFPTDFRTDLDERRLVEELVREKLLRELRQEVPHAIAVKVEELAVRDDGLAEVSATIFVERESQKGIVIGKGGERLKRVGSLAREELEFRWGRKVFLRLWVKVREDWRNRPGLLRDLGLYPG
ncbi:MAG: GTPase Era [Acidobacteria bacterium]|nr:MAG: GTPase Era [Acidobacteriota bacterium]